MKIYELLRHIEEPVTGLRYYISRDVDIPMDDWGETFRTEYLHSDGVWRAWCWGGEGATVHGYYTKEGAEAMMGIGTFTLIRGTYWWRGRGDVRLCVQLFDETIKPTSDKVTVTYNSEPFTGSEPLVLLMTCEPSFYFRGRWFDSHWETAQMIERLGRPVEDSEGRFQLHVRID